MRYTNLFIICSWGLFSHVTLCDGDPSIDIYMHQKPSQNFARFLNNANYSPVFYTMKESEGIVFEAKSNKKGEN